MDLLSSGGLTGIGLVGGFMAGFLGVGGAIIIIPLLLYGVGLTMNLATGISMVQAFFATLSGLIVHRRHKTVDVRLGLILGSAGAAGGLLGAFFSARLSHYALLVLYFCLLVTSLLLLFSAPRRERAKADTLNLWRAIPLGLGVGVLAGILGIGGGFVLIPLMIAVLGVPIRVAVGTSLVVILLTTLAGAVGKITTGQFDLNVAAYVVLGSVIGAQIGGRANSRVSARFLRVSMATILVGIIVRTGFDLI